MIGLLRSVQIGVADKPVDMRLGDDGLFARVKHPFKHDPLLGHLYVLIH